MYIEKHKHAAIERFLFVCSVQHSHMPLTFTKAFLTAFCLRMCENERFAGFPTQTQSACHCKGPAALSISANRHCLGFPPVCIFRMIIVQNIQYVCVIMETRMALVISPQEMALR